MTTDTDATPETQSTVVCRALQSEYPRTACGTGRNANLVVVRGVTSKDRRRIARLAAPFAHGFSLDVQYIDRYILVRIHDKQTRPVRPPEPRPIL